MKIVRFKFGYNYYVDMEFENDATEEDIDAEFQEWLNDVGEWEVIDEYAEDEEDEEDEEDDV